MKLLDVAVGERSRLMRFCVLLNAVAIVLAIWARDPLLSINTPFTGAEVGNITVGHAILIGQPLIAVLYLVFIAQLYRYDNILRQLRGSVRILLDWRFRSTPHDLGVRWVVRCVAETFRWFCMTAVPVVACGFLLSSQFDFKIYDPQTTKTTNSSWSTIFDSSFSGDKASQSFRTLQPDCCENLRGSDREECRDGNLTREKIRRRLPVLYQPWNFLFGSLAQLCITAVLVFVGVDYFRGVRVSGV